MKKILVFLILFPAFISICKGQKLVIGEKAPDIKISEWLTEPAPDNNRMRLIEFFHSSSRQSVDNLEKIENIASSYGNKLSVIVISRESKDKVYPILLPGQRSYYVALDEGGKTFSNYSVQFVPYCALVDGKGKVVWFGNSTSLDGTTLERYFR